MRLALVFALALVVVAVAGCGGQAARPPAAPSPAACATDDELYQVLVNPADDSDAFGERTLIYLSGAWSHEQDGQPAERGCLAPDQTSQITTALDRATWMQVVTRQPCPPEGLIATLYFVNGAPVYESTCGAVLDEPSQLAVGEIAAIMLAARGR